MCLIYQDGCLCSSCALFVCESVCNDDGDFVLDLIGLCQLSVFQWFQACGLYYDQIQATFIISSWSNLVSQGSHMKCKLLNLAGTSNSSRPDEFIANHNNYE